MKRAILQNAELKYVDYAIPPAGLTQQLNQTPLLADISQINQGVRVWERIGSEVYVENIEFRVKFALRPLVSLAVSSVHCLVRFVIFTWKKDTPPIYSDIFDNTPIGTPEDINSQVLWHYNVEKSHLYEIIADETYTLSSNVFYDGIVDRPGGGPSSICTDQITIPLNKLGKEDRKIHYYDATSGINKIYIFYLCDGVHGPYLSQQSRINYYDV